MLGFPGGMVVKNPPANAGDARDMSLIPGWGKSRGIGNGNPLQYSFFLIFIFLDYESMITHIQKIWKIQNKGTYSSTIYYNCLF